MASIETMVEQVNIAESLSDKKLDDISKTCYDGYLKDKQSRTDWEKSMTEWIKMATLVKETKMFPWPKSSNVKYPIVATAAMQFSARAYPTLIPSDGLIARCKVIGSDPDGKKAERAERIGKFMSWQLLNDMTGWEDDMDKLLIMLPVLGCAFKKTFYDKFLDKNVSKLVMPQDLIINYWAKDLASAERVTERIEMSRRILRERQLKQIFLDIKLTPPQVEYAEPKNSELIRPVGDDETTPYIILEQHTFLDLDDDGYPEPYIITFEESTRKVLRILARYTIDDVSTDSEGNLTSIKPVEYYTKYGFIPNPDGGFYDVGFGLLLGPINESVNSIINQLIDSGTISNLQSGFIGKGLRLQMGVNRIQPGEWKPVNATGDDLKKQIFPLPVREPSKTLFMLLELLIQSSKELASISEIFVGKMPGQNTPATTTMATIEQGMKVFTAIYKRVYRALQEELYKLFYLNKKYLDPQTMVAVLDQPINPDEFDDESYDICPTADPAATSRQEKLAKAQGLMEVGGTLGTLDKLKVTERVLIAMEEPNWQELISQQGPPPDPKMLQMQAKSQMDQQKVQMDMQKSQMEAALAQRESETKLKMEAAMNAQEMQFKQKMAELEMGMKKMESMMKLQQTAVDGQAKEMGHAQNLRHKEEQHKQQMTMKPKEKND